MQDNNANDQKVEMWTDGACKGNRVRAVGAC